MFAPAHSVSRFVIDRGQLEKQWILCCAAFRAQSDSAEAEAEPLAILSNLPSESLEQLARRHGVEVSSDSSALSLLLLQRARELAQSSAHNEDVSKVYEQSVDLLVRRRVLSLLELASVSACASISHALQQQNHSDSQDSDDAETPAMLCLDEAVDELLAEAFFTGNKNSHMEWWSQLTSLICDDEHGLSTLDQQGEIARHLRAREQAAEDRARGLAFLQRLLRSCEYAIQRALMVAFGGMTACTGLLCKFPSLTAAHPLQELAGSGAARMSSVYRSFSALYRTLVQRLVDPRADLSLRLLIVDQLAFAPQPHDLVRLLIRARTLPALAALERELTLRLGLASAMHQEEQNLLKQVQHHPISSAPSPQSVAGSVAATPALPSVSPTAGDQAVVDEEHESESEVKLKQYRQGHARAFAVISSLSAQVWSLLLIFYFQVFEVLVSLLRSCLGKMTCPPVFDLYRRRESPLLRRLWISNVALSSTRFCFVWKKSAPRLPRASALIALHRLRFARQHQAWWAALVLREWSRYPIAALDEHRLSAFQARACQAPLLHPLDPPKRMQHPRHSLGMIRALLDGCCFFTACVDSDALVPIWPWHTRCLPRPFTVLVRFLMDLITNALHSFSLACQYIGSGS